ncbi:MAG: hypothetical protein ACTSW1_16180 [Candidatus Hodarchaeales archaeon]
MIKFHIDPIPFEFMVWRIFLFVFPITAIILHVLLARMVYNDAIRNVESNEERWRLFTLLTGVLGVLLYVLIVKRSEKDVENYEVELFDSRIVMEKMAYFLLRLTGIDLLLYCFIFLSLHSFWSSMDGGYLLQERVLTDIEVFGLNIPFICLGVLLVIISSKLKQKG